MVANWGYVQSFACLPAGVVWSGQILQHLAPLGIDCVFQLPSSDLCCCLHPEYPTPYAANHTHTYTHTRLPHKSVAWLSQIAGGIGASSKVRNRHLRAVGMPQKQYHSNWPGMLASQSGRQIPPAPLTSSVMREMTFGLVWISRRVFSPLSSLSHSLRPLTP